MVIGQYRNSANEIIDIELEGRRLKLNDDIIILKDNLDEKTLHRVIIDRLIWDHEISKSNIKMIPSEQRFKDQKTTDMLVYGIIDGELNVVLIDRMYPPLGFSMPGGKIEIDETKEINMIKELSEEINLSEHDISSYKHIGDFECSEVRGNLTTSFYAVDIGDNIDKLISGSDAKSLKIVPYYEFENMLNNNEIIKHHSELILNSGMLNLLREEREINMDKSFFRG